MPVSAVLPYSPRGAPGGHECSVSCDAPTHARGVPSSLKCSHIFSCGLVAVGEFWRLLSLTCLRPGTLTAELSKSSSRSQTRDLWLHFCPWRDPHPFSHSCLGGGIAWVSHGGPNSKTKVTLGGTGKNRSLQGSCFCPTPSRDSPQKTVRKGPGRRQIRVGSLGLSGGQMMEERR